MLFIETATSVVGLLSVSSGIILLSDGKTGSEGQEVHGQQHFLWSDNNNVELVANLLSMLTWSHSLFTGIKVHIVLPEDYIYLWF